MEANDLARAGEDMHTHPQRPLFLEGGVQEGGVGGTK